MAMVVRFLPSAKYRLFGRTGSSLPHDVIFLSRMNTTLPPQDSVNEDDHADRRRRFRLHVLCYFLHAFLVALHIVLLVISASNHAEHQFTIPFDNEVFMVGLSGGLQAFYIAYTALLVFITQRLALSATFSSPKKLTQIHDICSAWSGLGAALNTLWLQTKIPSSVSSVVLVTMYFTCNSVLHVASSTVMQLQPFNVTVTRTIPAVKTWPGPTVNLSSLDWNTAVVRLLPTLQNAYGNITNGLGNNVLHDIPTQSFVNAMVNATVLNAHCGLLTNTSIVQDMDGAKPRINVSMTNMDPFTITVDPAPLLNEIFLSSCAPLNPQSQVCHKFILYLVTAAMQINGSVNDISPVYLDGFYGSSSQNISTPMYFVACSLDDSTHTATLGPSGNLLTLGNQPMDVAWSTFSPSDNMGITAGISTASSAMLTASPLSSSYCWPTMSENQWDLITEFDVYMSNALGMKLSTCSTTLQSSAAQYSSGPSLAYYTNTSSLLTRGQMESVVSQIATKFIWLAGELGRGEGGFDRQTEECQVTQNKLGWKLNINPLPVIVALCASVILFILVVCMLRAQNSQTVMVSAAGVLEIMWLGSRSRVLRDHFRDMRNPSVDSLRTVSMFETVFWTCPTQLEAHVNIEDSQLYAAVPLDDQGTCTGSSRYLGPLEFKVPRDCDCTGDLCQCQLIHNTIPDTSRSRRWCYTLHVILVALHAILLAILIHHPEHSVVILVESNIMTTSLSALLQAIYTLYSAVLVVITQRLALLRIVSERRKLTTVHDVSGAWAGIGAAIYVLWQQCQVTSSILETTAVATYLTLMSVLHIGSSSIMQWQAFKSTRLVGFLTSDLAFPGSTVDISQLGWLGIFYAVQSLAIGQDMGMSTHGLSKNTLYDVPQVPNNVTFSEASVNATTLDVQCGLVPNLTIGYEYEDGTYQVNFSLHGIDNGYFFLHSMWKDIVYLVPPRTQCAACPQTIFYMMTTGIDMDESVRDTYSVSLNWTYTPLGGNPQISKTLAYVAACSISARTVPATLYLQEYQLISAIDQTASHSSTSWSGWSPGDATDLNVGMATAFTIIEFDLSSTNIQSLQVMNFSSIPFTALDSYMMDSLGLNITSADAAAAFQSSANPSVTLSPRRLENAIAQTTAKLLWTAGQLGESGGGFKLAVGESRATRDALLWRLNLNTIPVVLVSVASIAALILVPFIIGKRPSKVYYPMITGTSVLECLWLETQSEELRSRLKAIEVPRSDTLRAAGMFDISLGDTSIERSNLASKAEANLDDA